MFNTPVLFLVFNRLDTTKKVFEQIRKVRPVRLYIAADGPRNEEAEDVVKCFAVKEYLHHAIDWPCEVKTLYREENLGCGFAVCNAIDWFFQQEEEGIILEDDCLPSIRFFSFCAELLEVFRNEKTIYHISGINHVWRLTQDLKSSFYFSRYSLCWGWATWRRAWQQNDLLLHSEVNIRSSITDVFDTFQERKYWNRELNFILSEIKKNTLSIWDTQWFFTILKNRGKSITPKYNLVQNIGFGLSATHTKDENLSHFYPIQTLEFPLHIPEYEIANQLDNQLFNTVFSKWIRKNKIEIFIDHFKYYAKRLSFYFKKNQKNAGSCIKSNLVKKG
jgi:hypothetical protein